MNEADGAAARGLATFILWDQLACVAGVVALLAVYLFDDRAELLLVEAAVVAAGAMGLGAARRPLRRGAIADAVTVIALASWLTLLAPVLITPWVEPIMIVAAQVPVVVACPHVSARRLGLFAAAATASTLCSVALARNVRLPGTPVAVPHWLPDVVVFAFLPILAGLVGLICRENQLRHFAAVAALRDSRARVLAATDDARRRIARDLHDGAQQHLIGAGLCVDLLHDVLTGARACTDAERMATAAALLEELADVNHDALTALRRLAAGVYATSLTDYGLVVALRSAVARFPGTQLFAAELPRLGPNVEAALYFSCLEAIQNAAKHAGPGATTTVTVATAPRASTWSSAPSEVRWTVADDGVGFTPAGHDMGPGIGFHTMADRLEAVGGRLEVRSEPGRGAVVEGSVPLHHASLTGPGAR